MFFTFDWTPYVLLCATGGSCGMARWDNRTVISTTSSQGYAGVTSLLAHVQLGRNFFFFARAFTFVSHPFFTPMP